jgi:hypothetical protein
VAATNDVPKTIRAIESFSVANERGMHSFVPLPKRDAFDARDTGAASETYVFKSCHVNKQ